MELNNIYNNIECKICYEKFIILKLKAYFKFIEENKHILPTTFEKDTYFHLWEDRFECLTCKNIICQGCYWSFTNHKVIPDEDIDNCRYYGELDENGLVDGCPGKDCPIICPFCRTRDYKIYYNNKMPYELLNEIKNRNIF